MVGSQAAQPDGVSAPLDRGGQLGDVPAEVERLIRLALREQQHRDDQVPGDGPALEVGSSGEDGPESRQVTGLDGVERGLRPCPQR